MLGCMWAPVLYVPGSVGPSPEGLCRVPGAACYYSAPALHCVWSPQPTAARPCPGDDPFLIHKPGCCTTTLNNALLDLASLTASSGAGMEGVEEAAPAGPSAVAGAAKRNPSAAHARGAGIARGAPAPAGQQQRPRSAAAQPAASNAAVACAQVRPAKRKAPAGADLAGPSTEKHLVSGVQAAALLRPHLDSFNPSCAPVGRAASRACTSGVLLACLLPALCTSRFGHESSLL